VATGTLAWEGHRMTSAGVHGGTHSVALVTGDAVVNPGAPSASVAELNPAATPGKPRSSEVPTACWRHKQLLGGTTFKAPVATKS